MESVKIRKATVSDISELVRLRRLMFESMGITDSNQLDKGDSAVEKYFYNSIPNKTFNGWVAVNKAGVVISSVGVVIDQHPPGPNNLSGKIAYIMNLYTLPDHRRQGVARRLMQEVLEWIKKHGLTSVSLHATDMGKNLYEQLGFTDRTEMRLRLKNTE